MRGAGCTYNDIVDRDYDARVARTAARPIPSGQVSVAAALAFLVALCLAGPPGAAPIQLVHRGARRLLAAADRRLPVREALHVLAAGGAGPHVQVGGAGRLGRRDGRAGAAGAAALRRLGAVDHRLRHHLRPPGQGGRRCWWASSRPRSFGAATPRWLAGFYAGAVLLWGAAGLLAGAGALFLLALALVAAAAGLADADARHRRSRQLPHPLQVEPAWWAGCCSAGWRPIWRLACRRACRLGGASIAARACIGPILASRTAPGAAICERGRA